MLSVPQKSREKNIGLEESRRRTEASLARKRLNVNLANAGGGADAPISPAASGAMDSLLEKLRAAAPQAKDQRDRRRRARLKERHQVRVASGQHEPDADDDGGDDTQQQSGDAEAQASENGLLSPPLADEDAEEGTKEAHSEGEDVADRAASMLQGLRSNSDAGGERIRRRRESADEERRNRRARRRNGTTSGSKDSADGGLPTVQEPGSPLRTDSRGPDDQGLPSPPQEESGLSEPPSIVVSEQHEPSSDPPADGSSANQPIELLD